MPKVIRVKKLFAPKSIKMNDRDIQELSVELKVISDYAVPICNYFRKMKDLLKDYDRCSDKSNKKAEKICNELKNMPVKNKSLVEDAVECYCDDSGSYVFKEMNNFFESVRNITTGENSDE